jgi:hypothetical protein
MRRIALVPVDPAICYEWLQDNTLIRRLLDKLDEINELDEIVLLTTNVLQLRRELHPLEDFVRRLDLVELPDSSLFGHPCGLVEWYQREQNADGVELLYLYCDPAYVLLRGPTIATVLHLLGSKPVDTVLLTLHSLVFRNAQWTTAQAVVPAVLGFHSETVDGFANYPGHDPQHSPGLGQVQHHNIDCQEALSFVNDPERIQLALSGLLF